MTTPEPVLLDQLATDVTAVLAARGLSLRQAATASGELDRLAEHHGAAYGDYLRRLAAGWRER